MGQSGKVRTESQPVSGVHCSRVGQAGLRSQGNQCRDLENTLEKRLGTRLWEGSVVPPAARNLCFRPLSLSQTLRIP